MIVFDGGRLSPKQVAAICLPPDELRSWAWSTPHEQGQRLSPLLARGAAASCRARAEGRTAYLEDGNAVS
jgi:hypothetical protein